jgi:cytidylate kinase
MGKGRNITVANNPQEIFSRQILKWEKRREVSEQQKHALTKNQKPVITISSAYGSQGWKVGKMVADLLGFDFYDRELVEQIAASANVREKIAASLDDREQGWISAYISEKFDNYSFTHSDFLRHLSRVVLSIGQHGEAVIVGRGSQFILKPQYVLRIRTIAPFELRLKTVIESEGLDASEARAAVLRKDAERSAFCRLHFNVDVADPHHYDLILNTSALSIEQNADFVVYVFLSRFGRTARAR